MLQFASKIFGSSARMSAPVDRPWLIPDGRRVYAIGDIHGRLDLLLDLTQQINRDDAGREAARTTLVFLGDLVDRGPDSREVVEFLIAFSEAGCDCVFLAGNHDDVFLRAVTGERAALPRLHAMGGRETAFSYGITAEEYDLGSFEDLGKLLAARVPARHVKFLGAMCDWHRIGDYVFVHAGIRPGRTMDEQVPGDLMWIRSAFLDHGQCHGAMVVHGHTVSEEPVIRHNRIGIDTGAFRSGKLTALGLQGADSWLLTT